MQNPNFLHCISPEKVIRGENAFSKGKSMISSLCKKPLLIGRSDSTMKIRNCIQNDLLKIGLKVIQANLEYDCCEIDLERINSIAQVNESDAIICAGGGKVLDAGKLIADRLNLPCITIPLSASTCAGWTALSNIYTPTGAFIQDKVLNNCPKLLIFDYNLVRKAPKRTLASGIADALAKWYEASISNNKSDDALVQQAVQMSRVLRDQLMIDSHEALRNPLSKSWVRVVEGCSLTAGIIGGIGGAKCRTAAAHAVHNGLTQLDFNYKPLHGELVGFGILVQLRIEEMFSDNQLATQAKKQLYRLLIDLNLPTNLKDLGKRSISSKELEEICLFSCRNDSDMNNLPFDINKDVLMKAIIDTDNLGLGIRTNTQKSFRV